jgi:hypothetical protein
MHTYAFEAMKISASPDGQQYFSDSNIGLL